MSSSFLLVALRAAIQAMDAGASEGPCSREDAQPGDEPGWLLPLLQPVCSRSSEAPDLPFPGWLCVPWGFSKTSACPLHRACRGFGSKQFGRVWPLLRPFPTQFWSNCCRFHGDGLYPGIDGVCLGKVWIFRMDLSFVDNVKSRGFVAIWNEDTLLYQILQGSGLLLSL